MTDAARPSRPIGEEETPAARLLELLRHKSPRVRQWAAARLAAWENGAALPPAAALAAREPHPDVLEELIDWFSSAAQPAHVPALVELGRKLECAGRHPQARRLLLSVLRIAREEAPLQEALRLLVGPRMAVELSSLRSVRAMPELFAAVKALCAARDAEGLGPVLAALLPEDPRQGLLWATAAAAFWNGDGPDRWRGLSLFLPQAAPRDDKPAAERTLDAWAGLLEEQAERERAAAWDCPALCAPPQEALLSLLHRAARDGADALAALAQALRQAQELRPEGLHDFGALAELLQEALDAGPALEEARARLRRGAVIGEAVETILHVPWPAVDKLEAALAQALASAPESEWNGRLTHLLAGNSPAPGFARARALALLARLQGPRALPRLAECLGDDHPPQVQGAAKEGLAALGRSALPELEPFLDAPQPSGLLLDLFARRPGERTSRMLAARAARLFERLPQEDVACALEACGGAAAAEALADAYRPGEPHLARALITLCELHDMSFPTLKQAYRDLAQDQKRERRVLDHLRSSRDAEDFLRTPLDESLAVYLRCRQCRHEYRYEVKGILAATDYLKEDGPTREAISFDRLIVCKRCAAVEDYDFGTRTQFALIAEFARMRLLDQKRDGSDDDEDDEQEAQDPPGFLRLTKGLSAAGRVFGNWGQALKHLLEESRRRPRDADIFKRLGNFYRNGGLPVPARQAYDRALTLDPEEMEAHFNLGQIFLEDKSWEKAHGHLRRVLELARSGKFSKDQRRDFARGALDGLAEIQDKAHLPIFPAAPDDAAAGRSVTIRVEELDLESDEDIDRVITLFENKPPSPS